MSVLARWFRALPATLWPACCLACGDPGDDGRDLCAPCGGEGQFGFGFRMAF